MKILTAAQTRLADRYTIEHEPIASIDLMERASQKITDWLLFHIFSEDYEKRVLVFCGTGNNGGDGLAVARQLWASGVRNIHLFVLPLSEQVSEDFEKNLQILPKSIAPIFLLQKADFEREIGKILSQNRAEELLLLDAIFGSGLNREVTGLAAEIILYLNSLAIGTRIAIDLPSGLMAENNPFPDAPILQADHTLTFETPKLAFLFDANTAHTGEWEVLSIGLHPDFMASVESPYQLLTQAWAKKHFRKRQRVSHKGSYGHALLLAGSKGKMGAAQLAAKAALRSGLGLLSILAPACGEIILQSSLPEAMCLSAASYRGFEAKASNRLGNDLDIDVEKNAPNQFFLTDASFDENLYKAFAIGCGLGTAAPTLSFFKTCLQKWNKLSQSKKVALVVDADALNLLAQNPELWDLLPPKTILTPHPKEWERLFGIEKNPYQRLEKSRKWAKEKNVILVLKGAKTAVVCPEGEVYFNHFGNAGMAVGGIGDTLVGIILGLLAQGYSPEIAAALGVQAHARAGDFAASARSQTAMLPSDLIENLSKVWISLEN
ncbi:bifunctional ADP-dependent NAD(P)H-hydrate dehydratase/NAD(P)H-hydrate epimerase [Hugenholtzia roseola]|uniref:bifunctional ADP-dependent NAD(P)H-hydrate dehydratase/NAD(P)H-hydrate epimerase n=1 Tax=Hugenholtzia roseola TaxID=1002 RepID=UPI000403C64F|nr:bifunctional ADP-dependent NAD(P)H-hydrate dehydratase/NAD(P)H-hydrate epimerase [Hugenholtzia roseola]